MGQEWPRSNPLQPIARSATELYEERKRVNQGERALLDLLEVRSRKMGYACERVARLALDLGGCSERWVQKMLASLERKGMIQVTPRRGRASMFKVLKMQLPPELPMRLSADSPDVGPDTLPGDDAGQSAVGSERLSAAQGPHQHPQAPALVAGGEPVENVVRGVNDSSPPPPNASSPPGVNSSSPIMFKKNELGGVRARGEEKTQTQGGLFGDGTYRFDPFRRQKWDDSRDPGKRLADALHAGDVRFAHFRGPRRRLMRVQWNASFVNLQLEPLRSGDPPEIVKVSNEAMRQWWFGR